MSIAINGNLEYEKLLKNDKLTVRIATPFRGTVKGALASDFGFTLGNEWNNLVSINSIPLVGDIATGAAGIITSALGASQFSLESIWMTSQSWTGYQCPEFNVKLVFIKYRPDVNLFDVLSAISEGMLPPDIAYNMSHAGSVAGALETMQNWAGQAIDLVKTGGQFIEDTLSESLNINNAHISDRVGSMLEKGVKQIGVEAPLGYGYNTDVSGSDSSTIFTPKEKTTFALEIGNWFSASHLIMKTGNFEFSKNTMPDGSPFSLTVNVSFRPYRNISYKEFRNYFKLRNMNQEQKSDLASSSYRKTNWKTPIDTTGTGA